jgi:hypothetical protein
MGIPGLERRTLDNLTFSRRNQQSSAHLSGRVPILNQPIAVELLPMNALLTLLILLAPTDGAPGDAQKRELAALEQLVGTWEGQGGCDGKLVIRSDGTYQLTGYGPGAHAGKGTWKVRWNEQPATLVLTCKESKSARKAIEVQILRLDDKSLKAGYANPNGRPSGEYLRAKE